MQVFKKHIAVLLIGVFLIPQVVSGMHYLLIPHQVPTEQKTTVTKSDLSILYHSCTYHLNSDVPVLPTVPGPDIINHISITAAVNYCSLENYVQQQNFNFQLRGPPFSWTFGTRFVKM